MQLYVTVKPDLPDGGPFAQMNPGDGTPFGVIEFGDNAYVSVKTDDEARRIIAVAARIIEMRQWIGQPHAFERAGAGSVVDSGHCIHCGMLGDSPDHAESVRAEHPFDAGEGSRELSGPGRELLAAAIAEQDAASVTA